MAFTHLHVTSAYSLLSSTISISELVALAKREKLSALALTDHNTMYGVIPFYKACQKEGIKPIIGLKADISRNDEQSFPLILLAETGEGYKNLMKISSAISTTGNPLPEKWLKAYSAGLIAITPGSDGEIETLLMRGQTEEAAASAINLRHLMGSEHFYLGLSHHQRKEDAELIGLIKTLAEETGIPLTATSEVRYSEPEDKTAYEAMTALRAGLTVDEVNLEGTFHFLSPTEVEQQLSDFPEALENTYHIASRCNVKIDFSSSHLPVFPVPEDVTQKEVLAHLCEEGLKKRVVNITDEYRKRLQYELDVIDRMGFNDYFLIIWDVMKFAREQHILAGPGRGSAAGSLAAYVLYITHVDPIEHRLLFERFLNPERVTLPDIDLDFPDDRRDEVIQYTAEKYGRKKVAQIATFGTLSAKAVARDMARVYGMSSGEMEVISKSIPSIHGITLKEAYQQSQSLQRFVNQSERYKEWFKTAVKLEGLPRHTSVHAAGVIISDVPLAEVVPLQKGTEYAHITQWPMGALEEIGLLKMDYLGLRNLTILHRVIQTVRQTEPHFKIEQIPSDDRATFELLGKGWTSGIFQFEAEGVTKVLMTLKPSEFEDLVAVNALNRPGPMEFIPQYIKRKYGHEKVPYIHQDLKPVLSSTYGIIVYQEQIMEIASRFAGFSLGEADVLRRAVSKKNKQDLDRERKRFTDGAVKKGYTSQAANELYDLIVRFADYGFNRSHAVAYSKIGYQLAYLKAHYPVAFMAALMTTATGNEDKTAQYIKECRKLSIQITPPDINKSMRYFKGENGAIIYSLSAIKGVSKPAAEEIIRVRQEQPFRDFFDLCSRLNPKLVNRKLLEPLIFSGALDGFGQDRSVLLASIEIAINHAGLVQGEGSLFEDLDIKPKHAKASPMPADQKLACEKEVLGIYLSSHPVSVYRDMLEHAGAIRIDEAAPGMKGIIGAFINEVRVIRTKKGENMCFITLSDETGDVDGVVFPDVFRKQSSVIQKGLTAVLTGKIEERNGKNQFVVQHAVPAEQYNGIKNSKTLFLRIPDTMESADTFAMIQRYCSQFPGGTPVVVYDAGSGSKRKLNIDGVKPGKDLLDKLIQLVGSENVVEH
ncbi:DNA polymerase III subunit alpha [Jeotgalibacillus haloalkalitolerans]|uniref:DNA polymerase III subunit alpha n=1 Tax=Jeotgalibacillus haloalkalitolerans TaxID=3104292 RepID=A0ABU5KMI4_9BACL|nr:DNA polymerase III subunit alpha [Jeotgalibacillus sp. HH7-29]MDZ5712458.1 DNA polymerase III subunit alpha [Jeotgalibacillus sp. HH7-29]